MRVFFLIFLLLLPWQAGAENYCNNATAQRQWAVMAAKYPQDDILQTLHALWIGLCFKVEHGELDEQRANDLFEAAREAAIKTKEKQKATHDKKIKAGI